MGNKGFFDYVHLQNHSFCVVSDSGSVTEESSILGFPAVTIRRMHECPEGMDVGTLIMTGLKAERVLQAVEIVTSQKVNGGNPVSIVPDYEVDNVSKNVVRVIMSYIDYIKSNIWHEHDRDLA